MAEDQTVAQTTTWEAAKDEQTHAAVEMFRQYARPRCKNQQQPERLLSQSDVESSPKRRSTRSVDGIGLPAIHRPTAF